MPIPVPNLDDRGFDDLVTDLIKRIPAHTPEWTDPQIGDPGRALIDLFAYLGDQLLYRANLIPERQRLAFLRLLDVPLRPARPATGLLSLQLSQDRLEPLAVPHRTAITGPARFESMEECQVLPLEGSCYRKRLPHGEEAEAMSGVTRDLATLYDDVGSSLDFYVPEPVFAEEVPQGLDVVGDSVDGALWIALLAPEKVNPATVKDVLSHENGGAKFLNIGVVPFHGRTIATEELDRGLRLDLDVYCTTGRRVSAADGSYAAPELLACERLLDSSDGLRQNGVLRVQLPDVNNLGVPPAAEERFVGAGIDPPILEDPAQAERLVSWLQIKAPAGVERLPLRWVGVHAVRIEQLRSHPTPSIVGTGTGRSSQRIQLPATNFDPASVLVEVEEEGAFRPWQQVSVLPGTGAQAAVYVLDAQAGQLRFGDGVDGRVPMPGARIRLLGYRAGGGVAGNLPAGSLKTVSLPQVKATQPIATSGGVDAETLDAAERRIPAMIRHGERAVTAADYQRLALDLPDASVGRAEVLPLFKPHQRTEAVPGVVSVMVLPAAPFQAGPTPRPDRALVDRVHNWLEPRRPLATELYVIGPEYVPVAVTVAVQVADPNQRDAVLEAVRMELRRQLWPLVPGGRDGTGWGLGTTVPVQELTVVVARVPGVRIVAELSLFRQQAGNWQALGEDGRPDRLELQAWQLPELEKVLVVDGDSAPDASALGAISATSGDGFAVPMLMQSCCTKAGGS